MLDIGWTELAVAAVLALLVIGPKELPGLLRTMGRWMRKIRTLAREFQRSVDEVIRESELDDIRKQVRSLNSIDVEGEIRKTVDEDGSLRRTLSEPLDSGSKEKTSSASSPDPNREPSIHARTEPVREEAAGDMKDGDKAGQAPDKTAGTETTRKDAPKP